MAVSDFSLLFLWQLVKDLEMCFLLPQEDKKKKKKSVSYVFKEVLLQNDLLKLLKVFFTVLSTVISEWIAGVGGEINSTEKLLKYSIFCCHCLCYLYAPMCI